MYIYIHFKENNAYKAKYVKQEKKIDTGWSLELNTKGLWS